MIEYILIAIGGFFGAIGRYTISRLAQRKLKREFPIATLAVNLLGSLLLGLLLGLSVEEELFLFLGTGFLGAFTTFSTMNLEAFQLVERKKLLKSVLYLMYSYAFGIILIFLGFWLGSIF